MLYDVRHLAGSIRQACPGQSRIASRNSLVSSLVVGARRTRASRPGLPDASGSALGASSLQTFGTPTVSHFLASGVAWGPAFDDRRG